MTDGKKITTTMALAAFALAPAQLLAEYRCDCTTITDSCAASVQAEAGWVTVKSNSAACSRVDYYIDGQPMVSTVVGGESREAWLSRGKDPQILVQSCQVCEDRAGQPVANSANDTASAPDDPAQAPGLRPIIQVEPAYPAAANGRSGRVTVRVDISPDGTVSGARVTSASPRGVFDAEAVAAVRRWRYPALPVGEEGKRSATEQVSFAGQRAASARSAASARKPVSDGRIEPRNGCIKAGQTHDLVDMLQVELVNACTEPVVVYACAEGLGRDSGKWICDSPSNRRTALLRPGDSRDGTQGSFATDLNYLRYEFSATHYVVHPPAAGYVWVGCALDDPDCHDAAISWQQLLQRKPSSVDPNRSGDIAVAASPS